MQQSTATSSDLSRALSKLRRAKKKGAEFTQKEHSFDAELENIKKQKVYLHTKRKMHHGQYQEWLSSVYKHTIIPYSKAWNLKIAQELQARLPRELRDMIWNYLVDFDTLASHSAVLRIAQGQPCMCVHHIRHLFDQSILPQCLSPEYVGATTALEVAQALYKVLNELGVTITEPGAIRNVLTNDCFYVGIDPMTTIRNLFICCKVDRYRTPKPDHDQTNKCRHVAAEKAYIKSALLEAEFGALLDVPDKKKFKLEIVLVQRNVRLAVLADVIEALRKVFESFRKHGASVTVVWAYRGHFNEEMPAFRTYTQKDITEFFDMDRIDWQCEMNDHFRHFEGMILGRHYRLNDELADPGSNSINTLVHGKWCDSENEDTTSSEEDSDDDDDSDNGSSGDSEGSE